MPSLKHFLENIRENEELINKIFVLMCGKNTEFKFTEEEIAISFALCFLGRLSKHGENKSAIFRFLDKQNILTVSQIFIGMFKHRYFIKECLSSKIWDIDYREEVKSLSGKLANDPGDFFAYAFNASFSHRNGKRKKILDSIKRIIPDQWQEFESILLDAASS